MPSPSFETRRTDVLGERIAAQIIDNILTWLLGVAIVVPLMVIAMVATGGSADSVGAAIVVGIVWIAPIAQLLFRLPYNVVFETIWDGQTPGKRFSDLRVVDAEGTPPSLGQVAVRNVPAIGLFEPFQSLIAVVAIMATDHHQRTFDLAASTYVVRDP